MSAAGLRLWQVVLGVAALGLAQAIVWSPAAPVGLKAGIVAIAGLAWWRPSIALLAVALLVPFGRMYTVVWIDAFPVRGAEAVALAFLAGTWLHAMWPGRTWAEPLPLRRTLPWFLLATLVVASAGVTHRVFQIHQDFPGAFFGRLVTHLATDYHGLPGDTRPWAAGAGFQYMDAAILMLLGIAVMYVTARLTANQPARAKRLVAATVLAGCGAALLSLQALFSAALETGSFLTALPSLVAGQRWAVHVTKVNSAASYLALVAPLAVGLAAWDRPRRVLWLLASATLVVALVLTGSLAALLPAIVATIVAATAWLAGHRTASSARRRLATAVVLIICLVPIALAAVRVSNRPGAFGHLRDRVQLGQASLRMVADRPLFGLGIGQYAVYSEDYVPEDVRIKFDKGPLQAHNYAIELLTELGPAGLGFFVWGVGVLAAGWRKQPAAWRTATGWPVAVGVALFLASALAGQPLLLDMVALPFWIVLGVLVGLPGNDGQGRHLKTALAVAIALIVVSVPFRMAREVALVDLTRIVYGAPEHPDPNRERVRVLTGPARFFVPADSAAFEIETYVDGETGDIELAIDDSGFGLSLPVEAGDWRLACVDAGHPGTATRRYRPVDVTPRLPGGAAPPGPVLVARLRGVEDPCDGR